MAKTAPAPQIRRDGRTISNRPYHNVLLMPYGFRLLISPARTPELTSSAILRLPYQPVTGAAGRTTWRFGNIAALPHCLSIVCRDTILPYHRVTITPCGMASPHHLSCLTAIAPIYHIAKSPCHHSAVAPFCHISLPAISP